MCRMLPISLAALVAGCATTGGAPVASPTTAEARLVADYFDR